MLRRLIHILIVMPNLAAKLIKWVINPKNGDDYVTPFKRHYLTTGASFAVTILYHLGMGLYTFISEYVLGAIAQLIHIAQGIVVDLWQANPSYSRWLARSFTAFIVIGVTYAVLIASAALKGGFVAMLAIFNAFR